MPLCKIAPMKPLIAAVLGLFLCGCSSFNREWKSAAPASSPPLVSIDGAWAGEWRSDKNGHHGSLRCVITRQSESLYAAHFRAKYWKIFQYTYPAVLHGTEFRGVATLKGEADLGFFAGGVYQYEATVTPTEFHATYTSKYDHGKFEMARPPH